MAQSLSYFINNTLPFSKSANTLLSGNSCFPPKIPEIQLKRNNFNGGIKAMKADPRDNSDQMYKPGLKRREPSAAPIGLWDRFPSARTVQQMLDTMDRMMEQPVAYNSSWQSQHPNNGSEYVRGRTPWEIKETEGKNRQENGVVESEGDDWSVKSFGKYSSRIALPENIDFEKIKAEVKDGVLYITIPKASSISKVFSINVE
ncbi:hypothetical protein SOVF_094820 [Spinacia oleracea]|nr:hypothetical protein SOVF_094820 [Spinacia oleracea]